MGFPGSSGVKNLPANSGDEGDTGSIPGIGRSLEVGNGNLLWYPYWRIPWKEEPGWLQSIGSQRFGHSEAPED